jgi:hypothetical protein
VGDGAIYHKKINKVLTSVKIFERANLHLDAFAYHGLWLKKPFSLFYEALLHYNANLLRQ